MFERGGKPWYCAEVGALGFCWYCSSVDSCWRSGILPYYGFFDQADRLVFHHLGITWTEGPGPGVRRQICTAEDCNYSRKVAHAIQPHWCPLRVIYHLENPRPRNT